MAKHVSVVDARKLQEQGHVYVDVRSSAEFEAGHPEGACNVPLLEHDEDTGQLLPNPDFVRVMKAIFAPDAKLLVGCQAGGRSLRAMQMLEAFGFSAVANVRGGFGGGRDPMSGRVVDPGWVSAGLPIETEAPPGRSYRELVEKANAAE